MSYVVAELASWRITHDASGKVLVRRFEKGEEVLFATPRWRDNGTVDRLQTKATVASDQSWTEVDQAIRVALEAAKDMGLDPRLDPAELPPKPLDAKGNAKEGTQRHDQSNGCGPGSGCRTVPDPNASTANGFAPECVHGELEAGHGAGV